MEIVCVVDEFLEIGQRKRGCADDVVDVSFDEARKRAIIAVINQLFLMTNKEAGVTWAKFTAHSNPRFLKVKLTVE